MRSKELDGQMNLFGSEPYQPKKAGNGEEHQVELDTEAEEFLSVGRRKKRNEKPAEKPQETAKQEPEKIQPEKEEQVKEESVKEEPEKKPSVKTASKKKTSGKRNIVMQRSYSGIGGQTATTAYVDYNLVYVQDIDGNASMTHYQDSKQAVDRYLKEIERFEKTPELKRSEDHPGLKNVTIREDGEL